MKEGTDGMYDNDLECQNPKAALFSGRPVSAKEARIHLDSFWTIFALICHLCLFRRRCLDLDYNTDKSSSKSCFQRAGSLKKSRLGGWGLGDGGFPMQAISIDTQASRHSLVPCYLLWSLIKQLIADHLSACMV